MKCLYTHNVWGIDRILRITVWIILLSYWCYTQNYWYLLGLIPLLTWIFAFCPFYPIFKFSTDCNKCEKK